MSLPKLGRAFIAGQDSDYAVVAMTQNPDVPGSVHLRVGPCRGTQEGHPGRFYAEVVCVRPEIHVTTWHSSREDAAAALVAYVRMSNHGFGELAVV